MYIHKISSKVKQCLFFSFCPIQVHSKMIKYHTLIIVPTWSSSSLVYNRPVIFVKSIRLKRLTCTLLNSAGRTKPCKGMNVHHNHNSLRHTLSCNNNYPTTMKPAGPRKFYQLPETPSPSSECGIGDGDGLNGLRGGPKKFRSKGNQKNTRGLMEMVERNIIGRETVFQGPFGPRRCK